MSPKYLFILSFIVIFSSYLYFLGFDKTLELIKKEYLLLLALGVLLIVFTFFKIKLKNHKLNMFHKNQEQTLKSTIIIFLLFEIYDYYEYDGFIGMISQWFLYWLMGLIALFLLENINYYKNYKMIYKN